MSQLGTCDSALSREEQLRRWQQDRQTKKKNPHSISNIPVPSTHNSHVTPVEKKKVVRVRIRKSNPTLDQPRIPSLRLYEQGTVASRLKSKTPGSGNTKRTLKTKTPGSENNKRTVTRPNTHPHKLKLQSKANDAFGRRKSAPLQNRMSIENRRKPISFPNISSTEKRRPPITPKEKDVIYIDPDQRDSISPLSCSVRSSIFGTPPGRRLPRHYDFQENQEPEVNPEESETAHHESRETADRYDVEATEPSQKEAKVLFASSEQDTDEPDHPSSNNEENEPQETANITSRSRSNRVHPMFSPTEMTNSPNLEEWEKWASPSRDRNESSSGPGSNEAKEQPSPISIVESVEDEPVLDTKGNNNKDESNAERGVPSRTPNRSSEESDDSFDWRDNLSPEFAEASLSAKARRRTDVSTLSNQRRATLSKSVDDCDEGSFVVDRRKNRRQKCSESPDGIDLTLNSHDDSANSQNDDDKEQTNISAEDVATEESRESEGQENGQMLLGIQSNAYTQNTEFIHTFVPTYSLIPKVSLKADEETGFVPESVVRVGERAILEPIRENRAANEEKETNSSCALCCEKESEITQLRNRIDDLEWRAENAEIQKRKLNDQVYAMRKQHDKRITPFRDLFDKLSTLRKENDKLVEKNQETTSTLESTVAELQLQMTEALGIALQKNAALQEKIQEAHKTIRELQGESQLGQSDSI